MALAWTQEAEDLVSSSLLLARSRSGRMAALNVAVPNYIPLEQVRNFLANRLAACGYPGLEILVRGTTGPLRITSAEFER